jgi:CTP synthase
MKAIQFARETDMPYLGICYGFQLAVVEFARNACGLKEANSTEINPNTPTPVIDLMPEQKDIKNKGATMRLGAHKVLIKDSTLVHKLYKTQEIYQRHRHRWEVNPNYWEILEKHGLVFSGKSPDGRRMEILELPDRFFFLASQFHSEFKSRPKNPDPEYYGFVKACLNRKLGKAKPEF